MQRVEAEVAVSVSELKKDPTAILDHNRVMAHMVPASTYEAMIDALDDQALLEIAKARVSEKGTPVRLDDL
jgi:antitoxin StbD